MPAESTVWVNPDPEKVHVGVPDTVVIVMDEVSVTFPYMVGSLLP